MKNEETMVGQFYGKHHKAFKYYSKTVSDNRVRSWLKQCGITKPTKDLVFMEAGGSGNKVRSFMHAGCRKAYYIDLSEVNTAVMKKDAKDDGWDVEVINGSILDDHPLNGACDFIMSTGVVHHTLNPAKALLNMRKWLKVGGVLYTNCYCSGTLLFFWVYLIRNLMSLIKIDYDRLFDFVKGEDIRVLEFMDHALVPIMHPTNHDVVIHDLKKLGFSLIENDKNFSVDHNSIRSMLFFKAKKVEDKNIDLSELRYTRGIDQLALEYDESTKNVLRDFFYFKETLRSEKDVLWAVLEITKIMNEIQDTISPIWRLRTFRKTGNLRRAFGRLSSPKQFFYNKLYNLFNLKSHPAIS